MTVFSRRTIGPKPRRTRTQAIAVVVVGLVVVLLIAEVITDAVDESSKVGTRALATWAAGVEPLLSSSSAMGQAVQKIDSADASMTRATLDATLATLTSVTAGNERANSGLGIQAPSARDAELVSEVLADRSSAAVNLAQSVALATTPQASTSSATASCQSAGAAMKAGDEAVGTLNGVFRSIQGIARQQFRKWSEFGAIPGSGGCASLVHTLRANQALALRSALKLVAISVLPSPVQINGVPNPTTTTSTTLAAHSTTTTSTTLQFGAPTTTTTSTTTTTTIPVTTTTLQIPPGSARSVLPPAGSVTADVVVEDSGTAPVKNVTVTVSLVASSGRVIGARTDFVPQIRAGGSAYLTIGPLHLNKVTGSFELKVAASASGVATARQVITLVRST
jgi:ribosomal protein S14